VRKLISIGNSTFARIHRFDRHSEEEVGELRSFGSSQAGLGAFAELVAVEALT